MKFSEVAGNRQTESQPAVSTGQRRIPLAEPLEHVRQKLFCDPFSIVFHRNRSVVSVASDANPDATSLGCEFDRVREEIPQDLLQPTWIPHNEPDTRIQLTLQRNFFGFCGRSNGFES